MGLHVSCYQRNENLLPKKKIGVLSLSHSHLLNHFSQLKGVLSLWFFQPRGNPGSWLLCPNRLILERSYDAFFRLHQAACRLKRDLLILNLPSKSLEKHLQEFIMIPLEGPKDKGIKMKSPKRKEQEII